MRDIYDVFNNIEFDLNKVNAANTSLSEVELHKYKKQVLKKIRFQKKQHKATIAVASAILACILIPGSIFAHESGLLDTKLVTNIFSDIHGAFVNEFIEDDLTTINEAKNLIIKTNAPQNLYQFEVIKALKDKYGVAYAVLITVDEKALENGTAQLGFMKCDYNDESSSAAMTFVFPDETEFLNTNQFLLMGAWDFSDCTENKDTLSFTLSDNKYTWKISFPVSNQADTKLYTINQIFSIYGRNRNIESIELCSGRLVIKYHEIEIFEHEKQILGFTADCYEYNNTNYLVFSDGSKVSFEKIATGGYYSDLMESFDFIGMIEIDEVVAIQLGDTIIPLK